MISSHANNKRFTGALTNAYYGVVMETRWRRTVNTNTEVTR